MKKWTKVNGFDDYEADDGNIRKTDTGGLLTYGIDISGNKTITLRKDGKAYTRKLDKVIADTFYPGDHIGKEVRHIDGNRYNNHKDNLEWVTKPPKRNQPKTYEPWKIKVEETGEIFDSIKECAEKLGMTQVSVERCLFNKSVRTHDGLNLIWIER